MVMIPKSVRKERLEENITIFDFELTEKEIESINSLNQNYRIGTDSRTRPFLMINKYSAYTLAGIEDYLRCPFYWYSTSRKYFYLCSSLSKSWNLYDSSKYIRNYIYL